MRVASDARVTVHPDGPLRATARCAECDMSGCAASTHSSDPQGAGSRSTQDLAPTRRQRRCSVVGRLPQHACAPTRPTERSRTARNGDANEPLASRRHACMRPLRIKAARRPSAADTRKRRQTTARLRPHLTPALPWRRRRQRQPDACTRPSSKASVWCRWAGRLLPHRSRRQRPPGVAYASASSRPPGALHSGLAVAKVLGRSTSAGKVASDVGR